jgi:hypothetical protein
MLPFSLLTLDFSFRLMLADFAEEGLVSTSDSDVSPDPTVQVFFAFFRRAEVLGFEAG